MTLATYLDSSALMDWVELRSSAPDEKAQRCGPPVEALMSDPQRHISASELTLIECLNSIHSLWRDTAPRKAGYDETWAREAQTAIMDRVEAGSITIRASSSTNIEQALMLVTDMTMAGRKFKAWDGVHLSIALGWAREIGGTVDLVTSDGDFDRLLEVHPMFGRFVNVVQIR